MGRVGVLLESVRVVLPLLMVFGKVGLLVVVFVDAPAIKELFIVPPLPKKQPPVIMVGFPLHCHAETVSDASIRWEW